MRTVIILAGVSASLAANASAAALEAAAAGARQSFSVAQFLPVAAMPIPGMPLSAPPFKAVNAASEGSAAPLAAPAAEADLKTLLNAHLKGQLTLPLGGKKAFIGGVFDRQQNAFLSVWIEGDAAPLIFNIKGLLDKAGSLKAGAVDYSVYLEPNPLKPLKSRIAFENKANENDNQGVRLGPLLDAIEASGQLVQLAGQAYRLFYYQDVQEGPAGAALNPNSRTFALILKDGEEMHVFLIPEETVPSDQMAIFKVYKDKRVGLQRADGKIKVFEL